MMYDLSTVISVQI